MAYRKAWEVGYKRDRAAGVARYVDAEPTRQKFAHLADAHVPLRALARATGMSDTGVKAILDGTRTHVQRSTAVRAAPLSLAAIYSEQASGHVPRIGAVRRVQGLMALGWTHADLAAAGAPNTARLLTGNGQLVTADRWREIRNVYDRLCMTPGPSPETRGWAKALGYAPPLAWDEAAMDDPTAQPAGESNKGPGAHVVDLVAVRRAIADHSSTPPPLTPDEQRLAAHGMTQHGASDADAGERLGVADRTILRWRAQHPGSSTDGPAHSIEWATARASSRPRSTSRPEPSTTTPARAIAR